MDVGWAWANKIKYFIFKPSFLVNATIFGELGEVETVITTMVSMLEKLIEDYCTGGKVPDKPHNPQPNCEWEEYTETKEYLEKVID